MSLIALIRSGQGHSPGRGIHEYNKSPIKQKIIDLIRSR